MRVVLSTLNYDPFGVVELEANDEDSEYGEDRRRTNRVATLDGGAAFNDFGFTYSDKTITLKWAPYSKDIESSISRLVRLYGFIHVSVPDGVYLAGIENFQSMGTKSTLTLLVKSKLSGD